MGIILYHGKVSWWVRSLFWPLGAGMAHCDTNSPSAGKLIHDLFWWHASNSGPTNELNITHCFNWKTCMQCFAAFRIFGQSTSQYPGSFLSEKCSECTIFHSGKNRDFSFYCTLVDSCLGMHVWFLTDNCTNLIDLSSSWDRCLHAWDLPQTWAPTKKACRGSIGHIVLPPQKKKKKVLNKNRSKGWIFVRSKQKCGKKCNYLY